MTGDLADLAEVDVVIESAPEDPWLKRQVVAMVESVVRPDALIASTSSSIPAAWIARDAQRPERIVVAHYVWPAHRMPLVEVACHEQTSAATVAALDDLLAGQGKTQGRVADRPGSSSPGPCSPTGTPRLNWFVTGARRKRSTRRWSASVSRWVHCG